MEKSERAAPLSALPSLGIVLQSTAVARGISSTPEATWRQRRLTQRLRQSCLSAADGRVTWRRESGGHDVPKGPPPGTDALTLNCLFGISLHHASAGFATARPQPRRSRSLVSARLFRLFTARRVSEDIEHDQGKPRCRVVGAGEYLLYDCLAPEPPVHPHVAYARMPSRPGYSPRCLTKS